MSMIERLRSTEDVEGLRSLQKSLTQVARDAGCRNTEAVRLHPNHYLLYHVRRALVQLICPALQATEDMSSITPFAVQEATSWVEGCLSCLVSTGALPLGHPEFAGLHAWRSQLLVLRGEFQDAADELCEAAALLEVSHGRENQLTVSMNRSLQRIEHVYGLKGRRKPACVVPPAPTLQGYVVAQSALVSANEWPPFKMEEADGAVVVTIELPEPLMELRNPLSELDLEVAPLALHLRQIKQDHRCPAKPLQVSFNKPVDDGAVRAKWQRKIRRLVVTCPLVIKPAPLFQSELD